MKTIAPHDVSEAEFADAFFCHSELSREMIALRAYELWEQSGRIHGHDVDHWLQAECELAAPVWSRHPWTDDDLSASSDDSVRPGVNLGRSLSARSQLAHT